MRALWIWLLLLAVMPVRAAETSEVIALRYLPAGEFERYLLPRDGPSTLHIPLPAGLLAWTVDAQRNTLAVTGSAAAIEELKTVIRMLDVPPLHVQLAVRRFRTDAPAIRALTAAALTAGAGPPGLPRAVVLSPGQVAGIESRPALESANLDTTNNHPAHITQTGPQQSSIITVVPRVNGDNTVTLLVSMSDTAKKPGGEVVTLPSRQIVMARVAEGGAVLLVPPSPETVLLVRVQAILAPPDVPAKGE